MMKRTIMLVLLITLSSSFAMSANLKKGDALLNVFKSAENNPQGYQAGFFSGYVLGIADMSLDYFWCPTERLKSEQIISVVSAHMQTHPEHLKLNSYDMVLAALETAFPCKK